jgi:hypothetical protein
VLPPVGSARSAILLLECIEHFIGSALFSNPEIQIQVCSPGRLGARRSALLAIGFYLGSDTLRRYTLGDLATSFAEHQRYPRGKRLVLYDADGAGQSTYCHGCGATLIGRDWYDLTAWNLSADGRCVACGTLCAGMFDAGHGTWGRRRQSVRVQAFADF